MTSRRPWLLVFCALMLGGGELMAGPSREDRAYAAAVATFQSQMWGRSEIALAKFVQSYPKTTNVPMAVLLEAQAQFNQKKFGGAVALLGERQGRAGALADQYISWTGEAQFAGSNFLAAAETFTSLMNDFPDSPLRLRGAVEAAAAYGQLQQWPELVALLEATNGVFARQAQLDDANELVTRGRLLLAQARFAQKDYSGTAALLVSLNSQALKPELDWQRIYLLCQARLAAGELEQALAAATNLTQIAQLEKNDRHRAEGVVMRATILEKMGRAAEAIAAYKENLLSGTPDEKQREAILKIADLAAGLNQFSDAEQWLEAYLKQFPDSPQADTALLTAGELLLKSRDFPGATNCLSLAQSKFDGLLSQFPNSPLAGQALLDRGWCKWLASDHGGSLADFEAATKKDLSPDDLAVAKFKAGDALFAQGDFGAAWEHYRAVFPDKLVNGDTNLPPADRELAGLALYQSMRADLALDRPAGAEEAFNKIFDMFSDGELGRDSALLYGESLVKPGAARLLFEKLAPKFAGSASAPELKLAIARTYEQEQDWASAITNYEGWVREFPTNSLRPQADYALARANFQVGNEEGALMQFTNFVAQNAADPLAPQAQWWVAEHYFRLGGTNYLDAEKNYEDIFQNTNAIWKTNAVYYPAQLMAGRAAMGRAGYKDAASYFMAVISDTNCSANLQVQARFAYGAALMSMDSSDTNATSANLQTATNIFNQITQLNPTNEVGARAWGEIGNCAQQLGDYVVATNAYAQVFSTNSPANLSLRSEAQVGYGMVLEKMAEQSDGDDQTNLLNQALDNYLQVFHGENLREEKDPDMFWVKKAGLQAALLIGLLDVNAQKSFYLALQADLPPLADTIQKKLTALAAQKN